MRISLKPTTAGFGTASAVFHHRRKTDVISTNFSSKAAGMLIVLFGFDFSLTGAVLAQELPRLTTLIRDDVEFRIPEKPYQVLTRGDVEIVIVNNESVNDEVLPRHQAGYSGIARMAHARRADNLFVPAYAGFNFEHIHDGTSRERAILFEPRHAPMELRVIDPFTVDLYQPPTPHWVLESCQRFHLLQDGVIEMAFECIPHRESFQNGYIGLFWASYVNRPESLDIHFMGRPNEAKSGEAWVRGVTPSHGVRATHRSVTDFQDLRHDTDFPLTLVFGMSDLRYTQPWYFGISHGMALVQMFRPQDEIRISQSPSGGGRGNPAWDFQFIIPNYRVGQRYQFVMRAAYLPFESPEHVASATRRHRQILSITGGLKNGANRQRNELHGIKIVEPFKKAFHGRIQSLRGGDVDLDFPRSAFRGIDHQGQSD